VFVLLLVAVSCFLCVLLSLLLVVRSAAAKKNEKDCTLTRSSPAAEPHRMRCIVASQSSQVRDAASGSAAEPVSETLHAGLCICGTRATSAGGTAGMQQKGPVLIRTEKSSTDAPLTAVATCKQAECPQQDRPVRRSLDPP